MDIKRIVDRSIKDWFRSAKKTEHPSGALEWETETIHGCKVDKYEVVVVDWLGVFYRECDVTKYCRKDKDKGLANIRAFAKYGLDLLNMDVRLEW